MAETVNVPAIGPVKKPIAIGAVVGLGGLVVIYYYRKNQANQQAASAAQQTANDTASAADTGTTIDPETGYPYGSPEDQAALASLSYGLLPTQSGYGGGGYPYDNGQQPPPSGGGFTSNAQWAQAAEQYMGSSGADAIAAALGKYITGQPVTSDQQTIIQEAIAAEGFPPVPGPGGFPPSIDLQSGGTGGTVTVPNIVGSDLQTADQTLSAAGLTYRTNNKNPEKNGYERLVTAQTPKAAATVNKGTYVDITWVYKKT